MESESSSLSHRGNGLSETNILVKTLQNFSSYPDNFVADFLNELFLLFFSLADEDSNDLKELLILESSLNAWLGLLSQSGRGLGWGVGGGGRSLVKAY